VPAVIVDWHPREQHSAPVYVLLLGPAKSKDGMVLTAWTPKGRLSFAGPAHAEGETFRFSLRGVADFGVLPVDIAGEWTNQKLRLTRLNVGTSVPKRLEAEPDARSGS